jgi:dihydroorotase
MPPVRGLRDRDALAEALKDGTIDAVCSDHAPVDDNEKQLPLGEASPGASGVELLLPLTLKWAEEHGVPLIDAIDRITWKPSQVLGVPGGQLGTGACADICVFDPRARFTVNAKTLKSQGKNTPFLGIELPGIVKATVIDGHVDYEAN